jgi:hypothetical protein
MINNDELYSNQIKSDDWYKYTQMLNLDRITYITKKSVVDFSKELEAYCTPNVFKHVMSKPDLFKSKNAKRLCRNGVPPRYMQQFLLKMFDVRYNEIDFESSFEVIFKKYNTKNLNDYVPYFTGFKTLAESLPANYLKEDGEETLKEILWMLNSVIPIIEHSPIIVKITSLFLIFCNKVEVYEIMRKLLEINYRLSETYKIRFHFRFIYNDNYKIVTSIIQSLKILASSIKEIFIHFESINFPIEKLIEDMVFGFFMDYFNYNGIIKLLPLFLNEGTKILYRLIFAIFKTFKVNILQLFNADKVIHQIRKLCNSITDFKTLFNLSYTYKLTRKNNKYDFQKMPEMDLFSTKRNFYYIPKFNKQSSILTHSDIFKIWSVLPLNIKIRDADIVFQTVENGYSIKNIYKFNNLKDVGLMPFVLILVETYDEEVFGVLTSNMISNTDGKFTRPTETYLISVRENLALYREINYSEYIVYADDECLLFVNGKYGPALRIEGDLSSGISYENEYFESPALSLKNKFFIKNLEIIILI